MEEWREALQGKGLRINRSKTKYLRCIFSGKESIGEPEVTVGGEVVACMSKFKYLGSVIQSNGEIDGDVTNRIQAGWLKWRAATGVLCDKKFPSRLKGKFYRIAIRPTFFVWDRMLARKEGFRTEDRSNRFAYTVVDVW